MIVYTISDVIALVLLAVIMTGAVLFLIIGGIGKLLSKWSERRWKNGK